MVDGVTVVVDTRKAIALISYLAIEKSASRDTLAALLWAESSSERARATLRRTLSSLRAGIGSDMVESDRNRLTLTGPVEFDVDEFETALAECSSHGHGPADVCTRCIDPLGRASHLYRGDFLAGFSVRNAPEFEDWVRSVSQHLRIKAGEAFRRLSMARAADGDYPGAIAAVGRWIDLDPLHEPAHRLMMLLNAWAGDRPGAVDAYRGFVALLDRELGVSPLEETTELYDAILDEDLPPPPGLPRRVATKRPAPPESSHVLLDRAEEMEALRRRVDAGRSIGQVVVLSGRAWMGKTRLLEELAEETAMAGDMVVLARAFRLEQAIPYGVVAQILRAVRPAMEAKTIAVPDWAREETARLAPSTGPAPTELDSGRFGELRLLEAAFEVLAAASASSPMLLMVDDAQWLDAASARVISFLGRRIAGLSACLVLAVRPEESPPEPVRDLVSRANTVVELEPLTPDAIDGRLSNADTAVELIRKTGGVPLLVLEALTGSDGTEDAPPGVLRFMRERLAEIGDLARQVLAAASVLPGICDAEMLRHVSGRSEEEVVSAVEELVGARLLREVPGSGAGLGFTLDSLEDLTYQSISPVRRRLLHKRAAEALAARPGAGVDAVLAGVVAAHHREAGSPEAAGWYRTAGDLARAVYAHAEARNFYETALALGHPDAAGIDLALGEVSLSLGEYPRARQELTTAASRVEGPTLGLVEHRLGLVQRLLGRFDLANEHFERAGRSHPEPADLYADWALLNARLGDEDSARTMGEKAVEEAQQKGDGRQLARALSVLAAVIDDPPRSLEHLDRALALAEGDDVLTMAVLNNKARVQSRLGDLDGAIQLVEQAVSIAERTGHRHRQAALLNSLADLHHEIGRAAEAEQRLIQAVTLFASIDAGGLEPEVWLLSQW